MEKITAASAESKSLDITAQNIEQLKALFPDVFSEGKIDFDALKAVLGEAIDDSAERYNFTWNGKNKARQIAQIPSTGTLRPCKEESVNWDSTKNLFIEGDNLEVLKLLQKSYHKKVKMIYIDPPYNTGKDFVYKDNFHDNIKNYLEVTGQVDSDGNRLSTNSDTSGRYHSDWLNMMYPRLKLARNLLSDDGIIFVSIDDSEVDNLKKICSEVFGEDNFLAQFIWQSDGHTDNQFEIKVNHEYIVAFAKNIDLVGVGYVVDPNTREDSNLWKGFAENSITKNGHANPPSQIKLPVGFPCKSDKTTIFKTNVGDDYFDDVNKVGFITRDITRKYGVSYPILMDDLVVEDGALKNQCSVFSGWANASKLKEFISGGCKPIQEDNGTLEFYLSANGVIYYLRTRSKARNILSVLQGFSTTEKNRADLENENILFKFPKPVDLIKYLINVGCDSDGLVMDFFAGSGTLCQAVDEINIENGKNIKYIAVQLPEILDPKNNNQKYECEHLIKLGLEPMVSEITKLRIKRFNQRSGCRFFKLAETNIRQWESNFDNLEQSLLNANESIKADRSAEDVLYEILLKYGIELTVPVEQAIINGKQVFVVGAGALLVCLDDEITTEVVEGIAELKQELDPETTQVVFKDAGFADSVVKTNAIQILKQAGIDDVKSI
ncbi:site-specific DNA-methyltransferase [Aeromonas caviae]